MVTPKNTDSVDGRWIGGTLLVRNVRHQEMGQWRAGSTRHIRSQGFITWLHRHTYGIVCFWKGKRKHFSFAWADVVIIGHGTAEFGWGCNEVEQNGAEWLGRRSLHQEKFQGEKEKIVYLSGHTKKKKNFKREQKKIRMRQGRLWPAHLLATAAAMASSVVDNSLWGLPAWLLVTN